MSKVHHKLEFLIKNLDQLQDFKAATKKAHIQTGLATDSYYSGEYPFKVVLNDISWLSEMRLMLQMQRYGLEHHTSIWEY